jgi:hypothetical protein
VRSWKQVAQHPFLKQEVDAFTRCRVILMNGIEMEASTFSHAFARNCDDVEVKRTLARLRQIEHQQQNTINWLLPPDQTVLETTIAYEQVAIELTAYLAQSEPEPYLKMAFDFGLLEDIDHLYRYSQMLDLIHGKDPNEILQGRTDVFPGRPTQDHHNDAALRVLQHYDRGSASPISKAHALTLMAGEQQTLNYYKNFGPMYGSPEVRRLYAEISEVEEEHVTQYESLMDPNETWFEKWVMHEFNEVANYYTCYSTEVDSRIKLIWEMFLNYELEHLRIASEVLKRYEDRDARDICGVELPTPATFESNRDYVTSILKDTVKLRLIPGGEWRSIAELPSDWSSHRIQIKVQAEGAPSETVVRLRQDAAGSELVRTGDHQLAQEAPRFRTEPLDGDDAPNTVGDGSGLATPIDREVERLGKLATHVEEYEAHWEDGGGPVPAGRGAARSSRP